MNKTFAVITAAGTGQRLGAHLPKALVEVGGHSLVQWAALGLISSGKVDAICVTAPAEHLNVFAENLSAEHLSAIPVAFQLSTTEPTSTKPVPIEIVPGGPSRQASVYRGLLGVERLAKQHGWEITGEDTALIHDAARPFAPPSMIASLVERVRGGSPAVIPGLPVTDTIKQVRGENPDATVVVATPDRASLRSIQTPQAFRWGVLRAAHEKVRCQGETETEAFTDDAALVEAFGTPVTVMPGDIRALKVTTADDLARIVQLIPLD